MFSLPMTKKPEMSEKTIVQQILERSRAAEKQAYPIASTARKYFDQDGNEVTLHWLVRHEPEWARNRLIYGEREYAELLALAVQLVRQVVAIPRIGEYWIGQGGIYAGIGRDENGQMYHLIRGPEAPYARTHKAATEFAAAQNIDGHTDFTLPNCRDLNLLRATLGEMFRTDYWYWSCERRPGFETFAFAQYFSDGRQSFYFVSDEGLVCAVRRIPIESNQLGVVI